MRQASQPVTAAVAEPQMGLFESLMCLLAIWMTLSGDLGL